MLISQAAADFRPCQAVAEVQIDKREINTSVLVDNGQTVVLGGVYEVEKRDDLTKVPFLGDVPILGNLFK